MKTENFVEVTITKEDIEALITEKLKAQGLTPVATVKVNIERKYHEGIDMYDNSSYHDIGVTKIKCIQDDSNA